MAGYSSTPLRNKLGIKPGYKLFIIHSPDSYWDWLAPLPEGIEIVKKAGTGGVDFIHGFYRERKTFEKEFPAYKKCLVKNGILWISWPKKSSNVITDLDENKIREYGLKNGLVDVKVCAVDEVWSGLKFVFRAKDR